MKNWLIISLVLSCTYIFSKPVSGSTPDPVNHQRVQPGDRLVGTLSNGGEVYLFRSPEKNTWGVRVDNPGLATVVQASPVEIEYYRNEMDIQPLVSGYTSVETVDNGFAGMAEIGTGDGIVFQVTDVWTLNGSLVNIKRSVKVSGNGHGGFMSRISLATTAKLQFPDLRLFAPGMIYGSPDHLNDRAPAGMPNYSQGIFEEREESFPIPMCGVHFQDGSSIVLMNTEPDGRTVLAESARVTMIDEQLMFGILGIRETLEDQIQIHYGFPGSESTLRRYHPVKEGFTQEYSISFRMGRDETFHDFYSTTWRTAWEAMDPQLFHHDMAVVQKSLVDHLAGLVVEYEDRIGIPFWTSMLTGKNFGDAGLRDRDAVMGFVGKNLEGAVMLIRASYEDKSARGSKLYSLGMDIINSMIRYVDVDPPSGSGYNIETGEPSMTNPAPNHVPCCNGRMYLRAFTDDMRWVLNAYQWELARGREHYDWFRWCTAFGEWLLKQQKPDGSFPRSWYPGTDRIFDDAYESSYNAMAFLVKLDEVTGDDFWTAHGGSRPFLRAAIEAGEFCWHFHQSADQYVGGTLDGPNHIDKEAGTLSLEGYLALYEATGEEKWLTRAKAAGDYAETWIYAWNVPMPEDALNENLGWKKGVPMVGVNKISSAGSGVDQWMAGDVDEYARLYIHTGDEHYKEIAAIQLHNSKAMVALPGRLYDYFEPGAQQEHWGVTRRRGASRHRGALPWVTVNHITGIFGLKDVDMELFNELAGGK